MKLSGKNLVGATLMSLLSVGSLYSQEDTQPEYIGKGIGVGVHGHMNVNAPKSLNSLYLNVSYPLLQLNPEHHNATLSAEAEGGIIPNTTEDIEGYSTKTIYSSPQQDVIKHNYEDITKQVLGGVGLTLDGFPLGIGGGVRFIESEIGGEYKTEEISYGDEGQVVNDVWNEPKDLSTSKEYSLAPYVKASVNPQRNISLYGKYTFDSDLVNQYEAGISVYLNRFDENKND